MLRDNALAASGLLNLKIGGPSVYPYQPMICGASTAQPTNKIPVAICIEEVFTPYGVALHPIPRRQLLMLHKNQLHGWPSKNKHSFAGIGYFKRPNFC
jgi:hypothetical protein